MLSCLSGRYSACLLLFFHTCTWSGAHQPRLGCILCSAVLWISVLHGLSDVISIGSLWFSWGKGTKTQFHNSPKNPAQLSKCCQATSRLHSRSSCWCYQATSSHQVVHLKTITCLLILMVGQGFPPDLGVCSSRICEKAKDKGLS